MIAGAECALAKHHTPDHQGPMPLDVGVTNLMITLLAMRRISLGIWGLRASLSRSSSS